MQAKKKIVVIDQSITEPPSSQSGDAVPKKPMAKADTPSPERSEIRTIEEAAAKLRKTTRWMSAHSNGSRQPTIPRIKMGRGYGFLDEDLDKFIASSRQIANPVKRL